MRDRPGGGILDKSTVARRWCVDRLIVGYLGATVLVVALFYGRIPGAAWLGLGHAAAAAGYVILKRAAIRRPALRWAYLFAPFVLVVAIFTALGWIIPHLRTGTMDAPLARLDIRLFGNDPTRWFHSMPGWFASLLQLCYLSYYFLFVALAVVLIRRREYRLMLSVSAVIVGCFFTTYALYYLVPAHGPRTFYTYAEPLPLGPATQAIHDFLDRIENIKLDAFPSGHTALSVLCLVILFKLRSRAAKWLVPGVVGLIVSTVALRYHYAVDVIAGLLCVPLWYPLGWKLVFAADRRRHSPPAS